jgi:hypothetical protein
MFYSLAVFPVDLGSCLPFLLAYIGIVEVFFFQF